MARILYVHWDAAEARERAQRIRTHGHVVVVHSTPDTKLLRPHYEKIPDAVLIDLDRLPSEGRGVATLFRNRKSTRHVPLLFVGGDAERAERTRSTFPDAIFTTWRGIGGAITRARASAQKSRSTGKTPVAPPTMAGDSGTPLPRKLGVKAGTRLTLLEAPNDFESTLGPLPDDVTVTHTARGSAERVILFLRRAKDLDRGLPRAAKVVADGGGLWIAWPKKTSPLASDVTRDLVRATGLAADWVDDKICAIDDDWSGLCFARRKE